MLTTATSMRTRAILIGGILISLASFALMRSPLAESESVGALVANLPSLITGGLAAAIAIWAALRFGPTESLRTQWLLIGLGVGALFVGDATFAWIEVVQGREVPFPSVADAFYLLSFPVFAAGLIVAQRAFARSLDMRRPVAISVTAVVLTTLALWAWVFAPIIGDAEATLFEKVLGIFYPVGDLALLLGPALALCLALSRFGAGRLAWPWWWVVGGVGLIAVADTLFAVAENAGTYQSGSPIDLGWWLGYTAIAVGASLLVDIQRPRTGGGRS